MKLHSLTLIGCLISFVEARVVERKGTDNDANLIIEKLYSISNRLNSESTLKLLKQLSENYSSRIDDERFLKKNAKLQELIEVNNIKHDKCNLGYFSRLEQLMRSNFKRSLNVYNYLKEQRNNQFLKCREVFEEEMRRNINELDGATKNKVLSMRKSIIDTLDNKTQEGRYLIVTPDLLRAGVSNFVIKTSNYTKKKFISSEDGREIFSQEFARIPGTICLKLKEKLSGITDLFSSFLYGPELDLINQLNIEWLENMKICSIILQDVYEFSKEAFEIMKSYKPKRNGAQRLLCLLFGD